MNRALELLILAGEAAWIFAWAVTLGAWIDSTRAPLLDLPALLLILLLSSSLARLAAGSGRGWRWLRLATVVLGLVVAIAPSIVALGLPSDLGQGAVSLNSALEGDTLPRALFAGGLSFLAWRRGVGVGRALPDLAAVDDGFRDGVIAMSSLLAFVGLAGAAAPLPSDALIPSTLVVLLSGLIGMPLARILDVSARPRHRHGPELLPGAPWLVMLLTVVCGILAVTLVLARLFTFERIGAVLDAVGGRLDGVLRTVIYVLAIPFGLLVEALVFLARLLARPDAERPRPSQPGADWLSRLGRQGEVGEISPETLLILKLALGVLIVALLAWILWRAVSRLQRLWWDDDVEETRESVWTWPGRGAVWAWLLGRLRPLRARAALALGGTRKRTEGAERSVRGAYRDLLRLGAEVGKPRQMPETAREYQMRLARGAPEGAEEVRLITEAYAVARYGPPTASPPRLEPLYAALARLRAAWRGGR